MCVCVCVCVCVCMLAFLVQVCPPLAGLPVSAWCLVCRVCVCVCVCVHLCVSLPAAGLFFVACCIERLELCAFFAFFKHPAETRFTVYC